MTGTMKATAFSVSARSEAIVSSVIAGVLFTLVAWWLAAKLFGLYISEVANYSATYAGLAGIVVLMFFLYIQALILLYGAEVNRSIELEELKKMKTEFETAARDVESSVSRELNEARSDLEKNWGEAQAEYAGVTEPSVLPPPQYRHPKKNWRLKRGATPQWYKQRQGIRTKALSGAARVARFRPPRPAGRRWQPGSTYRRQR